MVLRGIIQDFTTGTLSGEGISVIKRSVRDLDGMFHDSAAQSSMDPDTLVYSVQLHQPVQLGLEGGLFWGSSVIEPGMIGDEYFFTKGHFHALRNRAEYYVTVRGEGALILMTEDRKTRMEPMRPGSAHYIPGATAHRVANVGTTQLCFIACCPSDAGYDYETIQEHGFGARVRRVNGEPRLVAD
jgi:glucose-6-phosphate isomerase, archaeal